MNRRASDAKPVNGIEAIPFTTHTRFEIYILGSTAMSRTVPLIPAILPA